MRIAVDTNVLISAILFPHGKVASVFSYITEEHDLIIPSFTVIECETVFDRKFPGKKGFLDAFFGELNYELFVTPKKINPKKYPKIRDDDDLPILVSAILSDADILITGDKDFEDIHIKKPLIFTPARYYELIKNGIGK